MSYRENYINSSAWVLRCSFNYFGQCEKPQSVGRVTGTDLPRFFCIVTSQKKFSSHADAGRSIGCFKSSRTMEKKNHNEELQSRREFFKKAAKGTLPILGILAFGPGIFSSCEKDDDGDGGGNDGGGGSGCSNCNGTCRSGCNATCRYKCSGGCKTGCLGVRSSTSGRL